MAHQQQMAPKWVVSVAMEDWKTSSICKYENGKRLSNLMLHKAGFKTHRIWVSKKMDDTLEFSASQTKISKYPKIYHSYLSIDFHGEIPNIQKNL